MSSHQKSNKRTASASLTPQKQPPKRIYVKLKKTADVYVPVPSKTLFPQASNTLPESSSPDVSFSASQEGKRAVVNAMNIFAQVVFVYVLDQNVQEAGPSTPVVVQKAKKKRQSPTMHVLKSWIWQQVDWKSRKCNHCISIGRTDRKEL